MTTRWKCTARVSEVLQESIDRSDNSSDDDPEAAEMTDEPEATKQTQLAAKAGQKRTVLYVHRRAAEGEQTRHPNKVLQKANALLENADA